jgi:hypothetical protein
MILRIYSSWRITHYFVKDCRVRDVMLQVCKQEWDVELKGPAVSAHPTLCRMKKKNMYKNQRMRGSDVGKKET